MFFLELIATAIGDILGLILAIAIFLLVLWLLGIPFAAPAAAFSI